MAACDRRPLHRLAGCRARRFAGAGLAGALLPRHWRIGAVRAPEYGTNGATPLVLAYPRQFCDYLSKDGLDAYRRSAHHPGDDQTQLGRPRLLRQAEGQSEQMRRRSRLLLLLGRRRNGRVRRHQRRRRRLGADDRRQRCARRLRLSRSLRHRRLRPLLSRLWHHPRPAAQPPVALRRSLPSRRAEARPQVFRRVARASPIVSIAATFDVQRRSSRRASAIAAHSASTSSISSSSGSDRRK